MYPNIYIYIDVYKHMYVTTCTNTCMSTNIHVNLSMSIHSHTRSLKVIHVHVSPAFIKSLYCWARVGTRVRFLVWAWTNVNVMLACALSDFLGIFNDFVCLVAACAGARQCDERGFRFRILGPTIGMTPSQFCASL